MARKISNATSDSSLSPPPDNLMSATEAAIVPQPADSGKKRKAETTPRTKRTRAQQVDVEDAVDGVDESPRPKRRATKKIKVTEEVEDEVMAQESGDGEGKSKKAVSRRNKTAATKKTVAEDESTEAEIDAQIEVNADGDDKIMTKVSVKKTTRGKKSKAKNEESDHEDKPKPKPKPRSKGKGSTAKILPPLADRTKDSKHLIGAHVSSAGGVHNSIINLVYIGANAFALFLKNQRKWETIEMDPEHAALFIQGCKDHGINAADCCLPHGSYLVNLAHPDPARKKQAYDSFFNDLTRCHALGIRYYNFHPGNANATTREEGIRIIAENLNRAHADPATGSVVTVLETMATLGNTIGGTFADIAAIINLIKDKSRVGVCLDTCHVFAAGYDLRSPEAFAATMGKFDQEIGLEYLKAFHVNDSKAPLSSFRDLHARIGTGYLGLQAFHNLMNDERFHGLPMVLETPVDSVDANGKKTEDKGIWAREIKMLESLVGMDNTSDEFKQLEAKLLAEGAAERERVGDQVQRKAIKDAKPKKKRATKKKAESEEDEEDMEE
ncbi:DNA-lyase [Alternaria rosae]|uniref:DNA-lyase n=1 Tax=Alternaria rosae TaxID=1187941 RepID=UPI001E8D6EB8|nr:DNA-lyase [Alternaria rosae]KAH6851542.1 DNA-lyase [Alternaria rosae]